MGGNVMIGDATATPINLSKIDRWLVFEEIAEFADTLAIDPKPWTEENGDDYLSGSSAWISQEDISSSDLRLLKGEFSDIDLLWDRDQADALVAFLDSDIKHAHNATLIGFKRSANTIVTLWDFDLFDDYTQVDFELVEFDYLSSIEDGYGGEPVEWARWAFSSSWDDWRLARVKGVAQKLLFRACGSYTGKHMVDTKGEKFFDTQAAFSNSGMREKFTYGKNWVVTGKNKDREFITDRSKIFRRIFPGVQVTKARVDLFFSSFIGMCDAIALFGAGKLDVVDRFAEIIFGNDAQVLYRDNPERDYNTKLHMFRELTARLNTGITPWSDIIRAYGNFQNNGLLEEAIHRNSV